MLGSRPLHAYHYRRDRYREFASEDNAMHTLLLDALIRRLIVTVALSGLLAEPAMAQTVAIIESYNASQDHYFIGSLPVEINALASEKLCLETAGSSMENVLKCNVYCTSVEKFATVNAIYSRYFPKDPPARIFVCVPAWPGPFDIEIDCVVTR